MCKRSGEDPVMLQARALFEEAGISLEELGRGMGYGPGTARRSAWQFLNKTQDPRLSMLRRFASAINVQITDLFEQGDHAQ